jgi:hypothetical protein
MVPVSVRGKHARHSRTEFRRPIADAPNLLGRDAGIDEDSLAWRGEEKR